MTRDRSHLIPEQRTDRNGKTSTRWVKQSSAEALAQLGIPAPKKPEPTYTQRFIAPRINKVNEFMGDIRKQELMERWVSTMSKRELAVLDSALAVCTDTSTDPAVVREQNVIRGIFHSLARGSETEDKIVLEMLTLRSAYCSEWSQREQPTTSNHDLKSYVYGLRQNVKGQDHLPLHSDHWVTSLTAVIRFAYEMESRFPNADFLPAKSAEDYVGFSSTKKMMSTYISPDLANLAVDNSSNIDRLIQISSEHQTNDAKVLRALMENPDGAPSLTGGWL